MKGLDLNWCNYHINVLFLLAVLFIAAPDCPEDVQIQALALCAIPIRNLTPQLT